MKLLCIFGVIASLTAGFAAKADVPVFGNSTNGLRIAYTLGTGLNSGESGGGDVGFTPLENLDVTSITVWLNGYTSQTDQGMAVSIYENWYDPSTEQNEPSSPIIFLSNPTSNDGTTAAFTFTDSSGPLVLDVGQEYWLAVDGTKPGSGPMAPFSYWESGGTPTGDANYDASLSFGGDAFEASSAMPAFTINTVPEPGVAAFASLTLLLGIGRVVGKRIKNRT